MKATKRPAQPTLSPTRRIFCAVTLFACAACGGNNSEQKTDPAATGQPADNTGGTGGNDPGLSLTNNLILAYPEGLSVSAFPNEATASASLADEADTGAGAATSLKAKEEQARKILTGEADSCLPPALQQAADGGLFGGESCYQFDQDMIYGSQNATGTGPQAAFSGTRDGTSNSGSGEACLVSFARAQLGTAVDLVDRATGLVQSLICQARKQNADVRLPQADEEPLDLQAALGSALGNRASSVTKAEMARLADVDGRPVYRTEILIAEPGGRTRRLVLTHSPGAAEDNSTYNGSLFTSVKDTPASGGGDQNAPKTRVLGVVYAKSSDDTGAPRLRYELKSARLHDDLVGGALTDAGEIDLNVSVNEQGNYTFGGITYSQQSGGTQNPNQAADGFIYIAFDMNPETNEGNLSYWQNPGGNYAEGTRGMVFHVAETGGALKGCGVTGEARDENGQAISIRKALREDLELKPRGFYHPFMSYLSDTGNPITGPQQRSVTVDNDSTGYFYTFTQAQPAQTVKWYRPLLGNLNDAEKFSTWQKGNLMTRQCFTRNEAGKWVIDTEEITEPAGFELIEGTSPKFIAPPPKVRYFRR